MEKKDEEFEQVTVNVHRNFYDFIKAYLEFFGKETTLEDFMREAIYNQVRTIYTHLEGIEKSNVSIPTGIAKEDWLGRFRDLAYCTAPEDDTPG